MNTKLKRSHDILFCYFLLSASNLLANSSSSLLDFLAAEVFDDFKLLLVTLLPVAVANLE